jgi:hypothetical protein
MDPFMGQSMRVLARKGRIRGGEVFTQWNAKGFEPASAIRLPWLMKVPTAVVRKSPNLPAEGSKRARGADGFTILDS